MLITSAIISGLGLGSMYGLIALGFHVTYVVSNTVNFSQGSAVMLGAVLGYTFAVTLGWPLALAVAMALLLCALFGVVVERALVRPFADRGSNAWLMATVAGGIVLDNAVLFTFGKEPRSFPSVLAAKPVEIFGAGVYPLQLLIPVVGLAIALGLQLTFHHTRLGKALLAVVQNSDAARLMGINVRLAVAASFMISTALAGLAGLLIAPLFNVNSDMGTLFGIKAFAVAILGGITSAWGVMLAGLAYGLIETLRWSPREGFIRLDLHLERLSTSASQLRFRFDRTGAEARLSSEAGSWVYLANDQRVRLQLARTGDLTIAYEPAAEARSGALELCVAHERLDAGDPCLRHKTTRRELHERAFAQAAAQGQDEAVLLNRSGAVADASRNSIFVERGGCLVTPPIAAGALPGVLRACLIAEGRVVEGELRQTDLQDAERWFIGNSLHGLRQARLV